MLDAPSRVALLTSLKCVQVVKTLNLVGAPRILCVADLHPLPVLTLPVEDSAHIDWELTDIPLARTLQVGGLDGLGCVSREAWDGIYISK